MTRYREGLRDAADLSCLPGVKVKEVRRLLVEYGLAEDVSTGDPELDELVMNLPSSVLEDSPRGRLPLDL
jgi:hypothetical protein